MTNELTNEQAINELKAMREHIEPYMSIVGATAYDMSIKALEQTSHLIDRPCEACDLRKEKGCCKWSCVFEEAEK